MVVARVTLSGLGRTLSALRGFRVRASDLGDAFQRIAAEMRDDAARYAPVLTGRLQQNMRAASARTKATVRVGNARLPYAGVQNYGNYNNIEAKYFMQKALDENEPDAVREIEEELSDLIRQYQLNN